MLWSEPKPEVRSDVLLSDLRCSCDQYLQSENLSLEDLSQKFGCLWYKLSSIEEVVSKSIFQDTQELLENVTLPLKSLQEKYLQDFSETVKVGQSLSKDSKRKEFELQAIYRLFRCSIGVPGTTVSDPVDKNVLAEVFRLLETVFCNFHEMTGFDQHLEKLLEMFKAFLPRTVAEIYAHFELPIPKDLKLEQSHLKDSKSKAQCRKRGQVSCCDNKKTKGQREVSLPLEEIQLNSSTRQLSQQRCCEKKSCLHSGCSHSGSSTMKSAHAPVISVASNNSAADSEEIKSKPSQEKSSTGVTKRQIAENVFRSIKNPSCTESLNFQAEAHNSDSQQQQDNGGSQSRLGLRRTGSLQGSELSQSGGAGTGSGCFSSSSSSSSSELLSSSELYALTRSASFDSRYYTIGGCTLIQKQKQPNSTSSSGSSSSQSYSSSQGESTTGLFPSSRNFEGTSSSSSTSSASCYSASPPRHSRLSQPPASSQGGRFGQLLSQSQSQSSQPSTPPKSQASSSCRIILDNGGLVSTPRRGGNCNGMKNGLAHGLSPVRASPHLLQTHMSPSLRQLLTGGSSRMIMVEETPPRKRGCRELSIAHSARLKSTVSSVNTFSTNANASSNPSVNQIFAEWRLQQQQQEPSNLSSHSTSSEESMIGKRVLRARKNLH